MKDSVQKLYSAFSTIVAIVLLAGTAAVALIATVSFLDQTATVARSEMPGVSYERLQTLFDLLLGAVIALELAHSVKLMVTRDTVLAQVRAVLVIGMLAVVRKLIVIEIDAVSGMLLIGLAASVVALGGAFALLIWIDKDLR